METDLVLGAELLVEVLPDAGDVLNLLEDEDDEDEDNEDEADLDGLDAVVQVPVLHEHEGRLGPHRRQLLQGFQLSD